jgi:A/G-specific adenine glycosylase
MNLSESLLAWYDLNKRPLPWRETRDPYKIWLSEVILQQTRIAQGTDYYHRFLSAFPDVHSLAAAAEQDVLKLWQGLGYYSRARNMHHTAIQIVEKHNGGFPQTADGLKQLKGIGDYTAAAIASICFDEPVSVLDGNVARLISRLFAFEKAVDTNSGRNEITALANTMMDKHHPGTFNQAMMEIGALVCTPKSPSCNDCPLAFGCKALIRNKIGFFPVKTPKKAPTARYMNYLVISFNQHSDDFILMRKRTGNDIWKNMYDFPCVETSIQTDPEMIIEQIEKEGYTFGFPFVIKKISGEYIHQLSHRRLLVRFIQLELQGKPETTGDVMPVNRNLIAGLPLPRLIDRYFADLFSQS